MSLFPPKRELIKLNFSMNSLNKINKLRKDYQKYNESDLPIDKFFERYIQLYDRFWEWLIDNSNDINIMNGMSINNSNDVMIFPDDIAKEFDFNSVLKNKNYTTISGIPVKIDRIIKDITGTTVIAISGTMIIQGVKFRGTWDAFGNIMDTEKTFSLFKPKNVCAKSILENYDTSLFQLVQSIELNDKQSKSHDTGKTEC